MGGRFPALGTEPTPRGITSAIRHEQRCNAINPVISYLKGDGLLDRNFLLGTEGDATNVILTVAGHKLRLFRASLAWLLACLLSLLTLSDLTG